MPERADDKKRRAGPSKRRRIGIAALLLLGLLLTAGGVGYWWFLSPARLTARASELLSGLSGASVSIGGSRPDWSGGLILHDVRLRVPELQGQPGRLLNARRVDLRLDRRALWRGRVQVEAVELSGLRLHVCELVDQARYNFQLLQLDPPDPEAPPMRIPRIRITDGILASGERVNNDYRSLGKMPFRGRLTQDPDNPERLKLALRETAPNSRADADHDRLRIDGMVSIDGLTAQGEVTGVAFAPRYRPLLPRQVRQYWADLNPEGQFDTVRFATDPDRGWRLIVGFDGVGLQMPLPAIEKDAKPLRMTGVRGMIQFEPDRVRIVKPLVGEVAGLRYEVNGSLAGYDDAAPFRFSVRTDAFDVPQSPRYIYALPRPVRDGFRMITPQGRLRVNMVVFRDKPGGPIDYDGKAEVLDGRGQYYRFPYELTECHGIVNFNRKQVRIMHLTGRTSGDGSATITGTIAPPNETAAVDLTVIAVDVPFDNALRNALDPKHRPALDMFFHQPSLDRLVEQGHVITYDQYNALEAEASAIRRKLDDLKQQHAADNGPGAGDRQTGLDAARARLEVRLAQIQRKLDTPAFDLGGRANVVVRITRPQGKGDLAKERTEIRLKQANVVFAHFPYPLRVFDGTLTIRNGRINLKKILATGPFGWEAISGADEAGPDFPFSSSPLEDNGTAKPPHIVLSGHVDVPTDKRPDASMRPSVNVATPLGLPLNATLIDALPEPQNRWLRKLNPTGAIRVNGDIATDKAGQPKADIDVTFSDVTAKPADDVKLTKLTGEARLTLHTLELAKLTGRFGDARLSMTGNANWREDRQTRMDFTAEVAGMTFDQPLLAIARPFIDVAPEWKKAFDRYQPRGRFDAALSYKRAGDAKPDAALRLAPASLSVQYGDRRIDFGKTAGGIVVHADHIAIDEFAGNIGKAEFVADGRVDTKPHIDANLKLRLDAAAIDDGVRSLLPENVNRLVRRTQLDGAMELVLDPLVLRPDANEDEPRLATKGRLKISGGRFDLGLPVRQFDGTLDLRAVQLGNASAPIAVDIDLNADRATIAERTITDIQAGFHRPAEVDAPLSIEKVRGELYGGAVTARGKVDLATRKFALHFSLAEVDLLKFHRKAEPDADAGGDGDSDDADKPTMQGRLAAAFNVQGRTDELDNVHARGQLRIDRGVLYDLPLSLGLLQVSHLSMPVASSFTEAHVDYYMKNDRITFEKIALDSPSLRMAGRGSLEPDSGKLDLTLTSSNPSAIKLGPLTEVVNGLRDQLVTVQIAGTLEQPRTKVKQLNGLTQAWRDVFGREESSKPN